MTNKSELQSFIERIERLDEERRTLMADMKEIYAEAKSTGFNSKIMRECVALRRRDKDERETEAELIATYMADLGDFASTPLAQANMP